MAIARYSDYGSQVHTPIIYLWPTESGEIPGQMIRAIMIPEKLFPAMLCLRLGEELGFG